MFAKSCLDLWKEETKQTNNIITFCRDLDQAMGNGVSVGLITEFCGPPGSGKTQMCLQLCINVQILPQFGGLGGKALYFDTNFNFDPHRLKEIAAACVRHCQKLVQIHRKDLNHLIENLTAETFLDGVYYKHVSEFSELTNEVAQLEQTLKNGEKIKLVVIDSLSFIIRNSIESTLERIRVNHRLLTQLHALAQQYKFAIVITNDVTTRIISGESASVIVPALGESHGHKINQRVLLGPVSSQRAEAATDIFVAFVEKSLYRPRMAVNFQISAFGIRGVRNK
ncbi:DNA repair protein RAD51 homolog 3-like [Uranotaenia lowii]|uniref:DNA repair protein RAD51 homolog 3-like n=1 Tax=Uranotaenia lowii TaxID=190385 RepID=UPI002479DF04|nr:DNA repair protein RAD51 homolog 3-like [Uranotaenia lowii]XP_055612328.1 DNA repair protein RAD51 homolog 3-like [Uranotaenia lowii]